jgi:type IV pilus assembly protein PilY1
MRMPVTLLRKAGYSVTIAAAVTFSSMAPANTLGLSDSPLFLAAGVEPNLIMAIDDSLSMDYETLLPSNDGAAWWRRASSGGCGNTDINSFSGCVNNSTGTSDIAQSGVVNFNYAGGANATWKKFVYLFPNGSNTSSNSTGRRRGGDGTNDYFAIPPTPTFAWSRSPNHNAAYFNPATPYEPWVSNGSYSFNDSSPTAARFDPVFETNLTMNLTVDRAGNGSAAAATACTDLPGNQVDTGHYFKLYAGMTLPADTCIRRSNGTRWERVTSCTVGATNGCTTTTSVSTSTYTLGSTENNNGGTVSALVAIRYFPATFYLTRGTALPTNYGYRATAVTTTGLAPNGTALDGYVLKPENFDSTAQYTAAIQNFANWFTYYRKRHQSLRAGLGQSFNDVTGVRVNGFTINQRLDVTPVSIDDDANKRALYQKFYTDWVRQGGTPNRTAVAKIIQNFRRTDNDPPVTASCQKNFGMLFTDGFSNAPSGNDGIVSTNFDGGMGVPYQDSYAGSLADAVYDAYANGVRGDLEQGKVLVPSGCPSMGSTYAGPLDCNRNPHMNFFAITLGARGLLFDPNTTVNPYTVNPPLAWPTQFFALHPSAVDDLWHATINGRGQLLNARSPQEISDKLRSVLRSIADVTSSAASAALNSGSITDQSLVYQARFRSEGWTGQLLSYAIVPSTGELRASTLVDASDVLPAAGTRKIFTLNSAGAAVPFKWENLQSDAIRVQQLDPASNAVAAERMVNYLRGDGTNEGTATGQYRVRRDQDGANRLGDIINSAPLYVGKSLFRYPASLEAASYPAFAAANATRTPVIYVGANDGMLHAFRAEGPASDPTGTGNRGRELFAYIPGTVFPNLRGLASQDYGHKFYVDGSPSMGDAFFARPGEASARWRTVVAGGLNKGGQAVYAIDVTAPESVDQTSVLWEYSDANNVDLGFTYSQPSIAKLGDGKWYAIFGNGYNSMLADGRASTTGNAVLFIVELGTGAARTIDTGVGILQKGTRTYGNGLSTPATADVDGDRKTDFVYAGDLYGNMWKFDVRSASPAAWNVALNGEPLFTARNEEGQAQPITVRPEIARGPNGNGQMVLFGTGKYIETADKLIEPESVQSFYGIIDRNAAVTYETRNETLLEQRITREVFYDNPDTAADDDEDDRTVEIRVTTDRQLGGTDQGWFIDLVSPRVGYEGERQVSNPTVRDGRVIFSTLIPDPDPCSFGGSSWLMELDLLDGSRLQTSPFDNNRDGQFDDDDRVSESGAANAPRVPGSGLRRRGVGIFSQPAIGVGDYNGMPVQYKYLAGSSGNIEVVIENPGADSTGRQSWRQIR